MKDIVIKKLTHELNDDYLDFFDNRAFSDGNPNGPCYCTSPNQDEDTIKQMVSEFKTYGVKETIRKYAVDMLDKDKISGYLAYDGDISIGWCNAADIDSYEGFVPEFARENKKRSYVSRKKVCQFCADKTLTVDYKDVDTLKKYISERGKILPRRVTGACAMHQRDITNAIKVARTVALLPFDADL